MLTNCGTPAWAWDDIDHDIDDLAKDDEETHADEAFLDEIAIEQAMRGEPVRLTRLERDEAIMRLTDRVESARGISQLLENPAAKSSAVVQLDGPSEGCE